MTTTEYRIGPPTPVTICQLEDEFAPVLDLYRNEKPQAVLEIGTASGGSLYHWLTNAQPGATIVTIDLPNPDYPPNDHLYPNWTPENVNGYQIRGDSTDPGTIQAAAEYGPYQWLFIDANHTYEATRADYDNYSPLVSPGGLILLHDIALVRDYEDGNTAGVWKCWREIQATGQWTREFRAQPPLPAYGIGAIRV